MSKVVFFTVEDGSFALGFRVSLEIERESAFQNKRFIKVSGKLPPGQEILTKYEDWRRAIERTGVASRLDDDDEDQITQRSCTEVAGDFVEALNIWLNSNDREWQKIKTALRRNLSKTDEIRVIIQSERLEVQRLPWHVWDLFSQDYPRAEIAVSLPEFQEPEAYPPTPKDKVKILTILGSSENINLEPDIREIERLPGAESDFIKQPNLEELDNKLRSQNWDVLFFAGHSKTDRSTSLGYLDLSDTLKIPIDDLKDALTEAIRRGLKLAIFNSCDGLGLARQLASLHIPQVIVMRESVPDDVAPDFLKHFLKAYSRGKSLYASVRQARERLEENWKIKYPGVSWLPVICQNPAEPPMTWYELRQGFRSTSRRQQLRDKNEAALLNAVKEHWVEGVLENSLHGRLRMELGLEKRLDAIAHPWGMVWETPEQLRQTLPPGTRVIDIMDRMGTGGTLLILGEPGSGKTISLLELAEDLIAHAEQDISLPIPVVFNLSTWKGGFHQTIFTWLVQELKEKYRVSKALSKNWIESEKLILLLDGLDEVRADRRESCIEALNQFLQSYGNTEIVVCSRIQDYQRLSKRLYFRGAVKIELLTDKQVKDFLDKADAGSENLQGLRNALHSDTTLQELACSPLTLNVMIWAYWSDRDLPRMNSLEERRKHLFNRYIERMFSRRKKEDNKNPNQGGTMQPYLKEKTMPWLIWLAQQLRNESQTIFLIEQMQPGWLPTHSLNWLYRIVTGLMFGLIPGLLAGLIVGLLGGLAGRLFWGLLWGLGVGLGFGLLLFCGVIFGDLREKMERIEPVETLKWSWVKILQRLQRREITGGRIVGAIFIGSILHIIGLRDVRNFLLIGAGMLTLVDAVIYGMQGPAIEDKVVPNQGIRQSIANTGIFTLIYALATGLVAGLTFGLNGGLPNGVLYGLLLGPIVGAMAGLGNGICFLQHFSLRVVCYRIGLIPWNYARFLDYATERIFLQKVGGGYIFIHRLLRDHFADLKIL